MSLGTILSITEQSVKADLTAKFNTASDAVKSEFLKEVSFAARNWTWVALGTFLVGLAIGFFA